MMIGNSGWKLAQDTFWACPSSVCTHVLFCNQDTENIIISEKQVTSFIFPDLLQNDSGYDSLKSIQYRHL